MADRDKYGYSIMEEDLEKSVWDSIDNRLGFVPKYTSSSYSWIKLPSPSVIFRLGLSIDGDIWNSVINSLFVQLGSSELYALDWQHDSFVFSPKDYGKLVKEYYDETRDCNVYFPDYYPNGDYHFFVDPNWQFGMFGHPWLKQIAVFGEELIQLIDMNAKTLGLSRMKERRYPNEHNLVR